MTREEQLQLIKVAGMGSKLWEGTKRLGRAGLDFAGSTPSMAAAYAPQALGMLGMGLGGYYGSETDHPILGALGGAYLGHALGRAPGLAFQRGYINPGSQLRSAAGGAAEALSGVARHGTNLLPVLGALGAGTLAAEVAPYGDEASHFLTGAALGLGGGILGRAGLRGGYRGIHNYMTGAHKPTQYLDPSTGKMVETTRAEYARNPPTPGQNKTSAYEMTGSFNYQIPGTPFGFRGEPEKAERLSGMGRWAPRSVIERAFAGIEHGEDPEALIAQARDAGSIGDPLLGAALGAMAYPTITGSPDALRARLIGALAGGSLGSLVNSIGADRREALMREALRGAELERQRFPMSRREDSTAASAPPMLLHSGTVS